ncbi:hypothetical protein T492DRAFT_1084561, partial [Pavlovales sp. CCMP2436]
TTVSFPCVESHLEAILAAQQRRPGQGEHAMDLGGADERAAARMARGGGGPEFARPLDTTGGPHGATAVMPLPRSGLGFLPGLTGRTRMVGEGGPAAVLAALARVTKWFAAIHVFILVVDALMGTASTLFKPYSLVLLVGLIPAVIGYVGASRLDRHLVCVYLVFCFALIGYSGFVTYVEPTIWKLLLLLLQVYMCRVVLRFYLVLRRLSDSERATVVGELRTSRRATLMPW